MRLNDIDISRYQTILLDRDGTINVRIPGDYVKTPEEFRFIPGVLDAVAAMHRAGKQVYIVTNQRGVGKGRMTEADLHRVHQHMLNAIAEAGGHIDGIYYATATDEHHPMRKPQAGMWHALLQDHPEVDPATTLMIGDGDCDEAFARNCGISFARVTEPIEPYEVIILAGGLGTRLRSVVSEVPKCMAPVADKPFLWYLLRYLMRFNVSRVILSVGYLRDVIFRWIDEVKDEFPFTFDYAVEETPLGTGGGIRLALEHVQGDKAFILNGDTFFDVDLDAMNAFYEAHNDAKIVLALKPMTRFDRYGTVVTDSDGRILEFREKQPTAQGLINGGVYVINNSSPNAGRLESGGLQWLRPSWRGLAEGRRSIFPSLPKFSFETEVLQKHCGPDGCLFGLVQNGYFIDIGIPEDYERAQHELIK